MTELAVFYEHPKWFEPLFAVLNRRGFDWTPIAIQDHVFDPAATTSPARVVLNRLAMSSFMRCRGRTAGLYYALAALDHWQGPWAPA